MTTPDDYDRLLEHLRCAPPRKHLVPSETILIHGNDPVWRPRASDQSTLPPEVSLRLGLWVLNVAELLVPSERPLQRDLHNELLEFAALLARFLIDPECPLGVPLEVRYTHPVVARHIAQIEQTHNDLNDFFLTSGGPHSGEPYRYPLVMMLRFLEQTVRLTWQAASNHSPRSRRLAGYSVWRAYEWAARLAVRYKRGRVPDFPATPRLRDATEYVATALWRAAVQTVPVANVLVVPLRRRALPRWEWDESVTPTQSNFDVEPGSVAPVALPPTADGPERNAG